jgi:hypothetical protein
MKKCYRGTKLLSGKNFLSQEMKETQHHYFQMYTKEHQPQTIHRLLYRPLQVYHLHGRSGPSGARIVKLLRSPRIDSKESILPAYVA